jgi:MSHA pilin protein MshD
MCTRPTRLSTQNGLSLIELVIFIVIVSSAIAGILGVLNFTSQRSADPQQRKQALSIAEGLLEEVMSARFTYCDPSDANAETATSATVGTGGCATARETVGPETGNARPFDNINDYVSAFATPTAAFNSGSNLTDISGTALPLSNYTATVTVTPESLNGITSTADPETMEVLRITVTVSYGNDAISLDGYRTRYAPNFVP